MNKGLYNDITNKLISLSEEQATPNKIRGLLLAWSNRMQTKDRVSVLCAFYNYMNGKKNFDFVNESIEWNDFFKGNFTNYFTIEVIKDSFDSIIFDDKMTDLILKFATDDVKKAFYEYAKFENNFFMKTLNTKYKEAFENLENKCIKLGFVEKKIEESLANEPDEKQFRTANEIKESQDKLKQQISLIEKEKNKKRDAIFAQASNDIGVDKDKLINKVGVDESYDIDKIVVDDSLIDMLKGDDAKAASVPKNMYQKMKDRIASKRKLKMVELDLSLENGISTLTLSKKDTIFDKIATTSKEVLRKIKKSAKEKVELMATVGYISKEIIKSAITNTNEKIKSKATHAKETIKQEATDLGYKAQAAAYNALVGAGSVQMDAQDFISDSKEKIDLAKQSAATKTAEKLRNFADRIEPSTDIVVEKDNIAKIDTPKESYTYINTPNGRAKVVLRAATKAGEIPVKEEIFHAKTAA